jgi:hypothetical protein
VKSKDRRLETKGYHISGFKARVEPSAVKRWVNENEMQLYHTAPPLYSDSFSNHVTAFESWSTQQGRHSRVSDWLPSKVHGPYWLSLKLVVFLARKITCRRGSANPKP